MKSQKKTTLSGHIDSMLQEGLNVLFSVQLLQRLEEKSLATDKNAVMAEIDRLEAIATRLYSHVSDIRNILKTQ